MTSLLALSDRECSLLVCSSDINLNFALHFFFFFQAEDGIRDLIVTGVQTCALPISFCWITCWWGRVDPHPPAGDPAEGLRALGHHQGGGKSEVRLPPRRP